MNIAGFLFNITPKQSLREDRARSRNRETEIANSIMINAGKINANFNAELQMIDCKGI